MRHPDVLLDHKRPPSLNIMRGVRHYLVYRWNYLFYLTVTPDAAGLYNVAFYEAKVNTDAY